MKIGNSLRSKETLDQTKREIQKRDNKREIELEETNRQITIEEERETI